MRKYVNDSGHVLGRIGFKTMRIAMVVLLALCLVGTGVGCGGDEDQGDAKGKGKGKDNGAAKDPVKGPAKGTGGGAKTASLMPSSALGMFRIDVAGVRPALKATIEKNKEMLKDAPAPVAPIMAVLEKIESVDVYLMPGGSKPAPLIAIRGSLGPDDLTGLLGKMMGPDVKLTKGSNGRYSLEKGPPVLMILGDEADDVPPGVILGGIGPMLTPEFIASLGKTPNPAAESMAAKIDTKAQIWGWVTPPAKEREMGAPSAAYGSINITGPNPLNASIVFADEANAAKMMTKYEGIPKVVKEIIAFKRDELTITITMVGEGDLIDNAIKVVKEVIADMANKMSGSTKGSGTNPDDICPQTIATRCPPI
jgi:hypothetical protein